MHPLSFLDQFKINLVIGFGSSFTGQKKGLTAAKDIDLIIVSNFFQSMSLQKRKEMIVEDLGKKIDPILLTTQEYTQLLEHPQSIVNVALKEGRILFDSKR